MNDKDKPKPPEPKPIPVSDPKPTGKLRNTVERSSKPGKSKKKSK